MAASFASSRMQSSFLGSSVRMQGCFVPSRVSPVAGTVVAHYGNKANLGGGKPWERTEVDKNGKPVKVEMHVKKGDIVQVRYRPCWELLGGSFVHALRVSCSSACTLQLRLLGRMTAALQAGRNPLEHQSGMGQQPTCPKAMYGNLYGVGLQDSKHT